MNNDNGALIRTVVPNEGFMLTVKGEQIEVWFGRKNGQNKILFIASRENVKITKIKEKRVK